MIELLVALAIMFVALLALAHTATVAYTDTGMARQRQVANQLANQLVEQVRGLPYDTLRKGLAVGHVDGDPRIVSCEDGYHFETCEGEKIVSTLGLPPTVPLVPHTGQLGAAEGYTTTYDWAVYVTEAQGAPDRGAYRVLVRVAFDPAQRGGGVNEVESETLVYAPQGCVDPATHPFAAPCQPYFYGTGSAGAGSIVTTGTAEGLLFDRVQAGLLGETADVQVEQVMRLDGALAFPGASKVVAGVETPFGSVATSAADTDPSTAVGPYQHSLLGPSSSGGISVTGGGNSLAVDVGSSVQGWTTSATTAGGANACAGQLDGLPCGYATAPGAGALTETLSISSGVGTATLASVAASSTPVTTYLRRQPSSGDGLLSEEVTWSLPEIRLGGLPSNMIAPVGWQGYWLRLTGFTATASAQAGEGATAPTITGTGQVQYWTGLGYATKAVTSTGGEIPIEPLSHVSGVGEGNTVTMEISGAFSIDPSFIQQESEEATVISAIAEVGSPLSGQFRYHMVRNLTEVADLTISVDAGSARATARYQAVPE